MYPAIDKVLRENARLGNPLPVVTFYRPEDPYGYCSNFSRHSTALDGDVWQTSEHYFQAMKSLDPDVRKMIREKTSPGRAAYLGRTTLLRRDWDWLLDDTRLSLPPYWVADRPASNPHIERVKDLVMWRILVAKFTQHADIGKHLVDTRNAILVEAADSDPYWGWGASRIGLNKLGFMLMGVRALLQAR